MSGLFSCPEVWSDLLTLSNKGGRDLLACDPKVPLQRSNLENWEHDSFGESKKAFCLEIPFETISMGFWGVCKALFFPGFWIERGKFWFWEDPREI